jgi:hypothetical protein
VSFHTHVLTPERFHEVFLLTAAIPLLAIPGFLTLPAGLGLQPLNPGQTIAEMENRA